MIYTDKTKRAIKLCFEAHAGQVDKSDLPYAHHPLHLAEQMDDEDSTITALLHDVVEDTEYTFDDLETMGFGEPVIDALRLLTHDASVPYLDYVREIAKNHLAKKVKLADITHNSDFSRLDHEPTEIDQKRAEKYRKAAAMLKGEEAIAADNNGHEYIDLGLSVKWAKVNIGAVDESDYGDRLRQRMNIHGILINMVLQQMH